MFKKIYDNYWDYIHKNNNYQTLREKTTTRN